MARVVRCDATSSLFGGIKATSATERDGAAKALSVGRARLRRDWGHSSLKPKPVPGMLGNVRRLSRDVPAHRW
jgi:hypothetical protein